MPTPTTQIRPSIIVICRNSSHPHHRTTGCIPQHQITPHLYQFELCRSNGAFPLRGTTRFGTARYGTAQLSSGRFAFPLQFSTALEWAGLFTCRYICATSTAVTSSKTRHKQTHNKGAYRRNGVFHSRHVDVFNSNEDNYKNAWDLPPAAETVVAVTQAAEEEGRCAALLEL